MIRPIIWPEICPIIHPIICFDLEVIQQIYSFSSSQNKITISKNICWIGFLSKQVIGWIIGWISGQIIGQVINETSQYGEYGFGKEWITYLVLHSDRHSSGSSISHFTFWDVVPSKIRWSVVIFTPGRKSSFPISVNGRSYLGNNIFDKNS